MGKQTEDTGKPMLSVGGKYVGPEQFKYSFHAGAVRMQELLADLQEG